ncbi:hypothetical protein B0H17DRAFT_1046053 [Mycena rosella]|uniref:GATA-type domain-containing protein n=1 Tax=Mycena rosella TaxID=1033263 RepID=A0AAD7DYV0_MYCRO|nr:hypothetical protein B0H17DRAFT_1046053 [Mycena rosella]
MRSGARDRRCGNCGTGASRYWYHSALCPGDMLCRNCGSFERRNGRARPAGTKQGPARQRPEGEAQPAADDSQEGSSAHDSREGSAAHDSSEGSSAHADREPDVEMEMEMDVDLKMEVEMGMDWDTDTDTDTDDDFPPLGSFFTARPGRGDRAAIESESSPVPFRGRL